MENIKIKNLKWWQIALLSIAVSALGGLSSRKTKKQEKQLYNEELKQAPWAPPAWVFAPAWSINNFFLINALKKILKSSDIEKKKLLYMQGAIWLVFISFNYIYFNKKSPILGAAWTIADALLATGSFKTAMQQDKKIAYNYLPLVAWTSFASSLAVYQALRNPDPLLKTGPLIHLN